MFWDDLMRRWRREVGALDQRLLNGAAGNVAALPAPRRRGSRARLVLTLFVIAILAAALLLTQTGLLPTPA